MSEEKQIFNHDLLLNDGDVERARRLYPANVHVLNWPSMKQAFKPHEEIAASQKQQSRRRGMWALAAGLSALWLAAVESRIHGQITALWADWIVAALIVALGVLGWGLGSQVLRGRTKLAWLHHRAATERFRQLHFQFIVRRLIPLATGDSDVTADMMNERELLLAKLKHRMKEGVTPQVAAIERDLGGEFCWLVSPIEQSYAPTTMSEERIDELLRAYADLRFAHQYEYATKKLIEGHGLWPRQPAGQAYRMRFAASILIILVAGLDILALILTMLNDPGNTSLTAWFQTGAIMAALGLLALRVMEEGVRPQAEVDRYESYRGEVAELSRKFDNASSILTRVSIMERLEELSYRELREFLILHDKASFVL